MPEFILYDVADRVCTITLNRPDVYNAFNDGLSYELQDALKEAANDETIRVVVLTGAGKAFCSGQDLKSVDDIENISFSDSLHKRYNPIIRAMRTMPKPIVCRMNGVAAGAGCSLALACDIIVAADTAKMVEVFVNIGLVVDSGSSFFLPRLVGYNKAFELATLGTRISADEGFRLGIINKVVSRDQLDEAICNYTDLYANAPTKAIGIMKKMLNKGLHSSLDDMLEYEAVCQEIAGRSNDYIEGVRAFIEKRKPEFRGN